MRPQWCVKQDRAETTSFPGTTAVGCSSHGLKLGERKDRACDWRFGTSRSHLRPWVYSFCAWTDAMAPGVSVLTEEPAATPQLKTGRTPRAEEGHTGPFPPGLFATSAAVCTSPSSVQRNNSCPPEYHSPFVQTFITALDTWCCIICLSALPLPQICAFQRKWLSCVWNTPRVSHSTWLAAVGRYIFGEGMHK